MRHIYLKQNITEYTELRKKDKKFYFKDGKVITKNQTLMPCVEILLDRERINVWGVLDLLDLNLLKEFQEIRELQINDRQFWHLPESGNDPMVVQVEKLRLTLEYICTRYRNGSAYAKFVSLAQVKECREMLINGQELRWILLAIIK